MVQIYRYIIAAFVLIGGFILMAASYYIGWNPKGLVVLELVLPWWGGGLSIFVG